MWVLLSRLHGGGRATADVLILTTRPDKAAAWRAELVERGYDTTVKELPAGSWLEVVEEVAAAVVILDVPAIGDIRLSDFCHWRGEDYHLPFLILIGAGDIETKVSALNSGADACLVPEVGSSELVARVTALLRRLPFGISGMVLNEGDLSLDLARRAATYQGRRLPLSPYEFRILRDLALQVMEYRVRFADSPGDARLTSALQRLQDYAANLEQTSRRQVRRRLPTADRPTPKA